MGRTGVQRKEHTETERTEHTGTEIENGTTGRERERERNTEAHRATEARRETKARRVGGGVGGGQGDGAGAHTVPLGSLHRLWLCFRPADSTFKIQDPKISSLLKLVYVMIGTHSVYPLEGTRTGTD
eukprot:SAG11_NODE_1535_length_4727_cov_4.389369_2_plen_127_part_00